MNLENLTYTELNNLSVIINSEIEKRISTLSRGKTKYFENGTLLLNILIPELAIFTKNKYKVSKQDIIGSSRKKEIVQVRNFICHIILNNIKPKTKLKSIGRYLNNRDHTTIIHSESKAQNIIDTEPESKEQYEEIRTEFLRIINQ